jgi:hypothetical protein
VSEFVDAWRENWSRRISGLGYQILIIMEGSLVVRLSTRSFGVGNVERPSIFSWRESGDGYCLKSDRAIRTLIIYSHFPVVPTLPVITVSPVFLIPVGARTPKEVAFPTLTIYTIRSN